jgi:hypothetical protein
MALSFSEDSDKIIIDNSLGGTFYVTLLVLFILFPIFALGGYAGWVSIGSHTDYVALICLIVVATVELGIPYLFFTATSNMFIFDKMQLMVSIEKKSLISKSHTERSFADLSNIKTETRYVRGGKYSNLRVILTLVFRDGTNQLLVVIPPKSIYLEIPAPQLGQHIANSLNIPFVQGEIAK